MVVVAGFDDAVVVAVVVVAASWVVEEVVFLEADVDWVDAWLESADEDVTFDVVAGLAVVDALVVFTVVTGSLSVVEAPLK